MIDAAAGAYSPATGDINYFHSSRPHLTICPTCCADRWNRTHPLRHIPSAAGFFLRRIRQLFAFRRRRLTLKSPNLLR